MNILYLGVNTGTAGHRLGAMLRLGHKVVTVNPYSLLPTSPGVGPWRRHAGSLGLVEIIRRRVLRSLESAGHGAARFDLVWIDHGDLVSARLVDDLKKRASLVVCYNTDDPFGVRDRMLYREFLKALPHYDLMVVVREVNVQEAYRHGAKDVLRVFMSADEVAHHPRQLTAAEREEWKSEVVFVGTAFPERGPFLAELLRLGVPLAIYGNGYQRLSEWPLLQPHWRPANAETVEGYANAIGAAKVCLGLLSVGNRDQHTTRSMEIPSLGGVLCAQRSPEHLALYEEDREAVFWGDAKECAAKCLALLADDSWRQEVGAAGQRRYLTSPWRNMQVVQSILEAGSGQLPARPLAAMPGEISDPAAVRS